MTSTPHLHADPSIKACAAELIVEAMAAINLQVREGASFFVARDNALESAAPGWIARYGREAADAAVRGLHMLTPHEILDTTTKRIETNRRISIHAAALRRQPGGGSWLNRACLRWFGRPLYGLTLAFLVVLGALHGPAPAVARESGAAPSQWRALALCGVSKPGPGRDRACRQFNSAERGAFRNYDAPHGSPRTWELQRAWELYPEKP